LSFDLRSPPVGDPDAVLLDALRAGDEDAFASLVGRYHTRLLHFAESIAPTREVAEEAVQDTWLGVVRGIDRFEGAVLGEDLAVSYPHQPGEDRGCL
jgi:RNA polymerase sigma-70 factor, ECF subfamily